jgi:hypothetical protein
MLHLVMSVESALRCALSIEDICHPLARSWSYLDGRLPGGLRRFQRLLGGL